MSTISSALQAAANASPSDKSKVYSDVLKQLVNSPPSSIEDRADNLITYVDSLLSSSLGVFAVRPLLVALIDSLKDAPSGVTVRVGAHIAGVLQTQTATYEEQDATVREYLAKAYAQEEDYTNAAKALQGINLETTQRQIPDAKKVDTLIQILRYYLEDDDTVAAETALNKVKNSTVATQVLQKNPELRLHYQMAQARILDSKRDFINASAEYFAVSLNTSVDATDRLLALSAAIKTAILAPAGPTRNVTLGKLYKDERAAEIQEYSILEKMFLNRLLSPEEVDAFAATLSPHQLAQTSDGGTVLSKAVVEHNLLATSRIYDNISTQALARILGLKDGKEGTAAEKAEECAARMVEQGRLRGEIDQIDGVIIFESAPGVELRGPTRDLRIWDHGVHGLVEDVEKYAAAINESFPTLSNEEAVR